jgi:hypothetical protein
MSTGGGGTEDPGGGGDPSYRRIDGTPFYFHGEHGKAYLFLECRGLRIVDVMRSMRPDRPDDRRTVIAERRITVGPVTAVYRLDGQHRVTWTDGDLTTHVVNCELALHNPGYYDPAEPHELIAIPHINYRLNSLPSVMQDARGLYIDGSESSLPADYEVPS